MFNRNLKYRFHRRDAPFLFVEDKATVLQDQPAQNYVAQVNHVVGQSMVLDARFGRMWGVFPTRYQDEVTAERHFRARHRPQHASSTPLSSNRSTRTTAIRRTRRSATTRIDLGIGAHDFKFGLQLSWEKMAVRPDSERRSCSLSWTTESRLRAQIAEYARAIRSPSADLGRVRAGSLGDRPRHHQLRRAP